MAANVTTKKESGSSNLEDFRGSDTTTNIESKENNNLLQGGGDNREDQNTTLKEGYLSQPFFPGSEEGENDLEEEWGDPPAPAPTFKQLSPLQQRKPQAVRGRRKIPVNYTNEGNPSTSSKNVTFSWSNILSWSRKHSSVSSLNSRNSQLMPAFNLKKAAVDEEVTKDDAKAAYLETETAKILKQNNMAEPKENDQFEEESKPRVFGCFSFLF